MRPAMIYGIAIIIDDDLAKGTVVVRSETGNVSFENVC